MSIKEHHHRMVAVEMDRLTEIVAYLPEGALAPDAEVKGGYVADEKQSADDEAPESHCVNVVYESEHELHVAVMCGGGKEWEIVSDVAIASI